MYPMTKPFKYEFATTTKVLHTYIFMFPLLVPKHHQDKNIPVKSDQKGEEAQDQHHCQHLCHDSP